jgi:hypothetical protein
LRGDLVLLLILRTAPEGRGVSLSTVIMGWTWLARWPLVDSPHQVISVSIFSFPSHQHSVCPGQEFYICNSRFFIPLGFSSSLPFFFFLNTFATRQMSQALEMVLGWFLGWGERPLETFLFAAEDFWRHNFVGKGEVIPGSLCCSNPLLSPLEAWCSSLLPNSPRIKLVPNPAKHQSPLWVFKTWGLASYL